MKWIALVILFLVVLIAYKIYARYYAYHFLENYMAKYKCSPITKRYDLAKPRVFFPKQDYEAAVLLLHGFTSSPEDFALVCEGLKEKGIPYNAILFSGYGLNNIELLRKLTITDWLNQSLDAYDQLAQQAKKVHIVGSSFGAVMGSLVTMYRPVDKFVAIAPAYVLKRKISIWVTRALNLPYLDRIIPFLIPYYIKAYSKDRSGLMDIMDPSTADTAFNVPVTPAYLLRIFYQGSHMINFNEMKIAHYYLFTAKHDKVIDNNGARKLLQKACINYQEFFFENSAHCMTYDFDRVKVAQDVVKIISEE